jgi:two-component system cell cycle sensor histidine kinase PleC
MGMSELTAEIVEKRREAEVTAVRKKREARNTIREARERLTSATGHNRAFDYELTRLFAQSRVSAMAVLALFTMAIGLSMLAWLAPARVLLWLSIAMLGLWISYGLSLRFLAAPPEEVKLNSWRTRFVLAEFVQSTAWVSIIFFIGVESGERLPIFLLVVLLVYACIGSVLSSSITAAVYAGLLPVVAVIPILFGPGQDMGGTMMLLMSFGAITFYLVLCNRLYATNCEMLTFRAEKDALIAELAQAQSQSNEARRRAEEANLAKSRFLATMSHELRTPLNAILGFSEVMKSELFGPHSMPQYKEYATDIHASGKHLLEIINEILDLSRIEAGRYELNEEAVDFGSLVDDCRHMLDLRARNRSLTIKQVLEPRLPKLWADERSLRQITINLLANAIKFTPQGGEITIKVGWTASGGQYLSISDNGPGIPEDEIPVVMSSFGRGTLAIKTAEQGTGLGLPIVKALVELHGGTFMLRSKLREGTEAIVMLPSVRVMEAVAPVHEQPQPRLLNAA